MIAVVKSTEANFATSSQTELRQQQPTRRTSWTVLLSLAPRRRRRRMSDQASPGNLPILSSRPTRRSPSPAGGTGSASPSPVTENRRFPGLFPGRNKKKNSRKQSRSELQAEPPAIRVDQDKRKVWASSFDSLLSDQLGIQLFQGFLRSEVSEENILFWKACQIFKDKHRTPDEQLRVAAQKIFTDYIESTPSKSAPHLVNIDHHTREAILQNIAHPSRDMFEKAEHSVYVLMCQDSYCRFVQSRPFKEGIFKDSMLAKK